jgi:hypothetical protein
MTSSKSQEFIEETPVVRDTAYVFDFDCTLTARHFYYYIHNFNAFERMYGAGLTTDKETQKRINEFYVGYFKNNEELDQVKDVKYRTNFLNLIFGRKERLEEIINMFDRIGRENLYIASRGDKSQILKLLRYTFGIDDLSAFIKDENVFGGVNKTEILKNIFKDKNIFYVDDDHEEHNYFVRDLSSAFEKITGYGVDKYIDKKTNKIYTFYNDLTKNKEGGIPINIMRDIGPSTRAIVGGADHYRLYLKYKSKYINLKSKINQK